MAYDAKGLQVHLSNGVTGSSPDGARFYRHASYITPDTPAAVETAGYFNSAYVRLPKNTVITAVMTANGTPVLKQYVVTASSPAAVTVAVQTAAAG